MRRYGSLIKSTSILPSCLNSIFYEEPPLKTLAAYSSSVINDGHILQLSVHSAMHRVTSISCRANLPSVSDYAINYLLSDPGNHH